MLKKFRACIDHDADKVYADKQEIKAWAKQFPQAYKREAYLGLYSDIHGTPDKNRNGYIQHLAKLGTEQMGTAWTGLNCLLL